VLNKNSYFVDKEIKLKVRPQSFGPSVDSS
jgi:hypothetical protein